MTLSVLVRYLYSPYKSQVEASTCMSGTRECCPVGVRIPELCVQDSTAVKYAAKSGVTLHGTSAKLYGTSQDLEIDEHCIKTLFRSSLIIILATFTYFW